MKITSKLLASLLLGSMMLGFAACGGGDDTVKPADDTTTAAETEPVFEGHPDLKDVNYDGRTFTFITRSSKYGGWETFDIFAEAENGEPLNDSVYLRNSIVEERYGIRIAENKQDKIIETVPQLIQAGDASYDAIIAPGNNGMSFSNSKLLVDLNSIDTLNLENEWWDANAVRDFSIAGKLYLTVGDMTFSDKDGSWVYTFNKKIADQFNIEYPYEMAKNGTWTYDKFYDMAKQVAADLNGDGQMIWRDDRFGIATEAYDTYAAFFYAGGRMFSTDNEDNYPEYVLGNQRNFDAFDKYYTIVQDRNVYHKGFSVDGGMSDRILFLEGRALFRGTTLNNIRYAYRDMEDDFGLVVAPKYDEAQESYGHIVSIGSSSSVICVPQTSPDLEFTGNALEALCYESTDTVRDTYLNKAFNGKYLRDEDSIEMLSMCLDSRVYNLSIIYTTWGDWFMTFYNISYNSAPNFSSRYASTIESVEALIDQTFESYLLDD